MPPFDYYIRLMTYCRVRFLMGKRHADLYISTLRASIIASRFARNIARDKQSLFITRNTEHLSFPRKLMLDTATHVEISVIMMTVPCTILKHLMI